MVGVVVAVCRNGAEGWTGWTLRRTQRIPLLFDGRSFRAGQKEDRMFRSTLLACSGLLMLAACEREPTIPAAGEAALAAPAPGADTSQKFFGREAFTIVMEQTGREVGTVTLHYREWGRRSAEITKLTNTETGRETDTRSFTDGAASVTIDNLTGEVLVSENPFFHEAAAEASASAEDAFGPNAMARMNAEATGESATIAGETCDYWMLMGAKKCVAKWGPTLQSTMDIGDTVADRKAIEVRIGDGGPDSAFVYVPPAGSTAPASSTARP
jgi:hypothetical protein